jgi:phosphoadenosine phosphosulfate reductase
MAQVVTIPTRAARIASLNHRYQHHAAIRVLRDALSDPELGRVAMVSSFGADSVALLHMISLINRDTPVLFIDTQMLFPETLAYQSEVAAKLGLTDIRIIRAAPAAMAAQDPDGVLHKTDTDACCDLRKTVPLNKALSGYDSWITGRKRFQGASRADLEFFEADPAGDRIKINPLAHWTSQDVIDYIINNDLPRHPLVAQGYPSIGCQPCTSPVAAGEDPRAGRWRGQEKTECGIHFVNGKMQRVTSAEFVPQEGQPIIVRDSGFGPEDFQGEALELAPDADLDDPALNFRDAAMIRIAFPSFSDGRGFTLARRLRVAGYKGRLRAQGHVIADQFPMARRSGFDEVEIDFALAKRQPWELWKRSSGVAPSYLTRLGRSA